MNRIGHFRRNMGWFGFVQCVLLILALLLLCLAGVVQQKWDDPAVWSPVLFFIPAALVQTRHLMLRMSALQMLLKLGQASVLGLLIVGIFAYQNGAVFIDFMVPAAWFTVGLTFWLLSHPMVFTRRRSMLRAAREFGRGANGD